MLVGGQFDTFPSSSFEGNPGLCNRILEWPCTSPRTTERGKGAEKEIINWHCFGISYGISFILAVLA
ncbi:tyrosine-sulfated glycopeptide receptor 1, partial [Olea europaea subsp. europaea]